MRKKLYSLIYLSFFNAAFCTTPEETAVTEIAKYYAYHLKDIVISSFGNSLYELAFYHTQDFFTDEALTPCDIFCKGKGPSHGCRMKLKHKSDKDYVPCRYYDLKCEIECFLSPAEWTKIKQSFPKTEKCLEFISSIDQKDASIWIRYCIENNLHGCKDELEKNISSRLKLTEKEWMLVQANKELFLKKLNQFKKLPEDSPGLNKTKCCQWIVDKLEIDFLKALGIDFSVCVPPPPKSEVKPLLTPPLVKQDLKLEEKLTNFLLITSISLVLTYFIVKTFKNKNKKSSKTIKKTNKPLFFQIKAYFRCFLQSLFTSKSKIYYHKT